MESQMKYFGESWRAPVCKEQVPTPIGELCLFCDESIADGDHGLFANETQPVHRECFIRQVSGSVGHQKGMCSCYGGNEDDPEGMTKRQAAIAACKLWESRL